MTFIPFEFIIGNNLKTKSFVHREDAYAFGIRIGAKFMREICTIMPNAWEQPSILADQFTDYINHQF